MPKIPTFKQPGQGFGIQPALENSQAGRAKGEQFGAFARTAASAASAASEFVQKSEEARLRNAVDIAEEVLSRMIGKLGCLRIKRGKLMAVI